MSRSILIVDDEPNMRWVLGRALEQAGYAAHSAENGEAAAGLLAREPIDLVLLDLKLRGEDGLAILRRLRERQPDLVVLILTAYGTVPTAVEAMQLGAADFLRKPFDVEEVVFKVARALERRAMQQELARLNATVRRSAPALDMLIGAEASWLRAVEQARQLSQTDDDLVLWGEPGSGRSTLARALHSASGRAAAPLVELDLSVYHDSAQTRALLGENGLGGAWAAAGGGTLVLRALGEAHDAHTGLLERLGSTGARGGPRLLVIAADDAPPPEALLARLPARLRIPPLRERPGDIVLLARHFAPGRPIAPMALQLLEQYRWPGNLPELRSVLERASQLADERAIEMAHLPERLREQAAPAPDLLPAAGVNLEQLEQALIRQALERAHGNKSRAAELLGLTRHTLLYRMEKYGISTPERE